jgi:hypothetical protein
MQLIGDNGRGSAWTHASLGLKFLRLAAFETDQNLCETTDHNLHLHEYTSRSVRQIDSPINSVDDIRPGLPCIFVSQKCHTLRRYFEIEFAGKCLNIYGSLPPENWREQAKKFK